jgi:hypothetical protein
MLFKIKKFMLPALIAVSKVITYSRFIEVVFPLYISFTKDEIWGVKKVCIERMPEIIGLL